MYPKTFGEFPGVGSSHDATPQSSPCTTYYFPKMFPLREHPRQRVCSLSQSPFPTLKQKDVNVGRGDPRREHEATLRHQAGREESTPPLTDQAPLGELPGYHSLFSTKLTEDQGTFSAHR